MAHRLRLAVGFCGPAPDVHAFDLLGRVGAHRRPLPPASQTRHAGRGSAAGSAAGSARQLCPVACAAVPGCYRKPGTSFVSKAIRPPDQITQPYLFGDDASKATGFWLTGGTPELTPTSRVEPRMVAGLPRWANQTDSGQNRLSPGENRWLERSATYPGIAAAMGDQWGRWLLGRLPSQLGQRF